jgi:hypothetical protein
VFVEMAIHGSQHLWEVPRADTGFAAEARWVRAE